MSTNDISSKGVSRVEKILSALASKGCRVNVEDNDEDSDDGDGSDSDISDIGDMKVNAGAGAGAGVGAGAGSGGASAVADVSAAGVEKVLDIRGPRGALDAARAEELCAPILRCVCVCTCCVIDGR